MSEPNAMFLLDQHARQVGQRIAAWVRDGQEVRNRRRAAPLNTAFCKATFAGTICDSRGRATDPIHAGATMRVAPQWLRRQRSVFRRGILVAVVLSIFGVAVADDASAASKSASGG